MFSDKLDLIMRLTNSKNSVLSRAVHLDASAISRFRSGERSLPKKPYFIPAMSEFFARNITDEYQKKAMEHEIPECNNWPSTTASAAKLIHDWLISEENVPVTDYLSYNSSTNVMPSNHLFLPPSNPLQTEFLYGRDGKRNAVRKLLNSVIDSKKSCTLLLYSDEEMSWLYENPYFTSEWAGLLFSVIDNGSYIRIVHDIRRGMDEMLESFKRWMPIYSTGRVDPYYYPRLRDGIYRNTIFIAPNVAAIRSTSVGANTEKALNIYTTEEAAIDAMAYEFQNYFDLCKPLMQIYKTGKKCFQMYSELEHSDGNISIVHSSLSLATMPQSVAESIAARCNCSDFLIFWKKSRESFEKHIKDSPFTELIILPSARQLHEGQVALQFSVRSAGAKLYYTPEEYSKHLKNILTLAERYPQYEALVCNSLPSDMSALCAEGEKTLLINDVGDIVFSIKETETRLSFEEYLHTIADQSRKLEKSFEKFTELLSAIDNTN